MLYANYRKVKLDKFRVKLSNKKWCDLLLHCNAGFILDEWLIDKGVVPVQDFEEWRNDKR